MEKGTSDDKQALNDFFNWILSITKTEHSAFVFLVSSEEYFYFRFKKQINYIRNIVTIGNLSQAKAKIFFDTYLENRKIVNMAIPFSNLYKISGILFIKIYFLLEIRWKHESH